ncbi:MAG: hypothetical protein M1836_003704 [Candelina mexicana]|nr:MAG: hypothetical protein M1836_003704 [Candelina mexicana]
MWLLECDGDFFDHKRTWLRPGKEPREIVFGRTKNAGSTGSLKYHASSAHRLTWKGGFIIDNKSISRRHLTLTVGPVKPGDGSQVFARSELSIKDHSKLGTHLDNEKITNDTGVKILNGNEHVFRMGSYELVFRIKWQPVVLSFSFSSKEEKLEDPLKSIRERLEPLDIKVIIPYTIEHTTHVVASKRNTAKGLQALINGKYIVTDSFINALVYAGTPQSTEDGERSSLLEVDFDAHWPDPMKYLPAPGKEPSERPAAFFAPNTARSSVFEGYSFVFCDQKQIDTLRAPITNGGGKALHYELDFGKTTSTDLVRYVKHVAGEKDLGEFADGSEGKGVVVVRFRARKEFESWAIELGNEVARRLDQRLIEQSEFLDAILVNDASGLRKPLPEEDDDEGITAPPPTAAPGQESGSARQQIEDEEQAPPSAQPVVSEPVAKRIRSRRTVTSRFKGFDDFDPSSLPPSSRKLELEDASQMDSIPEAESALDIDSQNPSVSGTQTRSSKKRRTPPSDSENEDEVVNNLLPAAAAMKKRRLAEEAEEASQGRRGNPKELSSTKSQPEPAEPQKKGRKVKKEPKVLEVARERRQAEEEAARQHQEALQASMEGMDVEQMRNLAVIEDMDIAPRPTRSARADAHGDTSSRWDERWNGRKNFKRFRRRGDGHALPRRGQGVIVGLEEVKKKDYGIGDGYWLESSKEKKKKGKERDTQTQSQPFATAKSQLSPANVIVPDEMDVEEEIVQPMRTRRGLVDKTSQAQPVGTKSPLAGSKRAAPATRQQPTPKRQKKLAAVSDDEHSDDDSEDDLKFRFAKRR